MSTLAPEVTITGPPFISPSPRLGYAWVMPLSRVPDRELAEMIDGFDWWSIGVKGHPPKMLDNMVQLSGPKDRLPAKLDDIVDTIERLIDQYAEMKAARGAKAAESARQRREERATGDALGSEWWARRQAN